jgi:hypothetical protein
MLTVTYWYERDLYDVALERLDHWAKYEWRAADGEAKLRALLLELRSRRLDANALLGHMKKRHYDARALRMLDADIHKPVPPTRTELRPLRHLGHASRSDES